jgi:hypothetical protein
MEAWMEDRGCYDSDVCYPRDTARNASARGAGHGDSTYRADTLPGGAILCNYHF